MDAERKSDQWARATEENARRLHVAPQVPVDRWRQVARTRRLEELARRRRRHRITSALGILALGVTVWATTSGINVYGAGAAVALLVVLMVFSSSEGPPHK